MRGSFTVLYFIFFLFFFFWGGGGGGEGVATLTNHFNEGPCNANDGIVIKILCSSLITYFYQNIFVQKAN